jgi:hypothetical protein
MKKLFVLILMVLIVGIAATASHSARYWAKAYGGNDWNSASSIQQTIDSSYIIAGDTRSYGIGYNDVWILRIDSNGNIIWQKTYGTSGEDIASSIQQTSDGGFILAGRITSDIAASASSFSGHPIFGAEEHFDGWQVRQPLKLSSRIVF